MVTCPVPQCGAVAPATDDVCAACGSPLRNYARLSAHPAYLFNEGLTAARADRLGTARDMFAAVVYWCPFDVEARNALAFASFLLDDREAAGRHWTEVLAQRPNDAFAAAGLARLEMAG